MRSLHDAHDAIVKPKSPSAKDGKHVCVALSLPPVVASCALIVAYYTIAFQVQLSRGYWFGNSGQFGFLNQLA